MGHHNNILLLDDHPIVLAGLRMLVAREGGYDNVFAVSNVDDAQQIVSHKSVQVAVVDLELRDGNGLSLVDNLRKQHPQVKIVIYTMHEELWVVRQIKDKNVDAVVTKGDDPKELLMALRRVSEGRDYFSPQFLRLTELQHGGPPEVSGREMEVLEHIVDGQSSAEIARQLHVSDATIEFHRRNLMRKLQASNVAQMVRNAMQMGLRLVKG